MTWILLLSLAFMALVIFWVAPKFSEYRAILGINAKIDHARTWAKWLTLQIQGLKTVIVNTVLPAVAILPELQENFTGVDLAPVIGEHWAGKVIVVMAILTTITHVIGVASAAKAEPVRPEGE